MRIQAALDLLPKNGNVNILHIINTILDKGATAWKEKLDGHMEISNKEAKALMDSMRRKSDSKEQGLKWKAKDAWVTQKCAEILQNASKTYDYAETMAAGLADLAGMCDDRNDFKEIMKVVVGLPSLIQQQAEAKVKEAEEQMEKLDNRMEPLTKNNVEQLMIATGLPKFKEDWESPEFEVTKYLAAIFEFWLRKSMFLGKKPNIHNITVKFRCSHTQLQKYVQEHQKLPQTENTTLLPESARTKKKRKEMFLEDADTENITPKKKLKVRKMKLHK